MLEKMTADLKPCNTKVAKLSGAMLLREFLMMCVLRSRHARAPYGRLGVKKTSFA